MKHILYFLCTALFISASTWAKAPQRPNSYNYQVALAALYEEGDYSKALDYFNKELKDNPNDGYSYSWIAYIRAGQKEYGRALTCANSALKLLPKADKEYCVFAYSTRANTYKHLRDTAAAIADWTQAIKIDPTEYKSYSERAELYYYLKKYQLADADYQKMIKLDDNQAVIQGYMGLGRNLKAQEHYEDAIALFTKVITLYGDEYSSAYSFRAECLLQLNRNEEAVRDIVKALEIDADDKAFWMMINLPNDESVELMQQKLKLQTVFAPNQPTWHYFMGVLAEANHQYKDAVNAYRKANAISHATQTDERIALCYEALGDYPSALQYINYAIEMDSTRSGYYYTRANIHAELGLIEKSIDDMTRYIEFEPKNSYGYYRRGWWKHLLKECDSAIEDFNLSIAIDPEYPYAYDALARCYHYFGDSVKAISYYEKLLAFDTIPTNGSQAYYAFHYLGQDDKAIKWIEQMLEKDSTETYDAACVYSIVGDTAKALYYLEKRLQKGWTRFHHLEIDEDLDNIRNLDSFKSMVEKYYRKMLEQREPIAQGSELNRRIIEVPYTKTNGVTKVDCSINGLPLSFIFDTGASDVTISQVEANFMYKNGYLSDKDFVGKQHYQTADWNISVGTIINLDKINIGGLELRSVRASVVQSQNAPLLLGQSVLQRLGKIEIDNTKRVIKITTR